MGFFQYLFEDSNVDHSLANSVRTNPSAISVFRSIFMIDPMEALEDFMTRKCRSDTDVSSFLTLLETTECTPAGHSSIFEATRYSPLLYALQYSPHNVVSLLAEGENAGEIPALAFAVHTAMPELIGPLLDAGADVNMADWLGYTPLHYSCAECHYDIFHELVRLSRDIIDWATCTPDGKSALDLFNSAVAAGRAWHLPRSQILAWRSILESQLGHDRSSERNEEVTVSIPGTFQI